MHSLTLLCPMHIAPYLLVVIPIFLLHSGLLPLIALYRLYWYIMYSRGLLLGGCVRIQGRVIAPGRVEESRPMVYGHTPSGELVTEPFLVLSGDDEVRVDPARALLRGWPRQVRLGDLVTVDGVDDALPLAGEQAYRQNGVTPGLKAIQIVGGCPPQLRRATRIIGGIWLVSLGLLMTGFIL